MYSDCYLGNQKQKIPDYIAQVQSSVILITSGLQTFRDCSTGFKLYLIHGLNAAALYFITTVKNGGLNRGRHANLKFGKVFHIVTTPNKTS